MILNYHHKVKSVLGSFIDQKPIFEPVASDDDQRQLVEILVSDSDVVEARRGYTHRGVS